MFPEKKSIHVQLTLSQQEHALYEDITDTSRTTIDSARTRIPYRWLLDGHLSEVAAGISIRAIQRSLEKRARVLQNGGQQESSRNW